MPPTDGSADRDAEALARGMRALLTTAATCWICGESASGATEPVHIRPDRGLVAHARCEPLAELAERAVYTPITPQPRHGLARRHVRTQAHGGGLLCGHRTTAMRRVGTLRDHGGVVGFAARPDACPKCVRKLARQSARRVA